MSTTFSRTLKIDQTCSNIQTHIQKYIYRSVYPNSKRSFENNIFNIGNIFKRKPYDRYELIGIGHHKTDCELKDINYDEFYFDLDEYLLFFKCVDMGLCCTLTVKDFINKIKNEEWI
jgi:hypothetical protein